MNYNLLKTLISLAEDFENQNQEQQYNHDIQGFEDWLYQKRIKARQEKQEPDWEAKENGRSAESVINTLLVHLNRYARMYAKAAIQPSGFSTPEEFIYLINLKAFGAMTKMQLIKKNIQEKSAGMQIINRLLHQGWIQQRESAEDKRSKVICISPEGEQELATCMDHIRTASHMVTGDLSHAEKMELIRLLSKLDHFHNPVYCQNLAPEELLETVSAQFSLKN